MKLGFYIFLCLLLMACNNEQASGPVEIIYDRDVCERCRMIISDRYHAAQIREPVSRKVYKFDDIGGAIIWLQDKPYKDDLKTEIWVAHHKTGEWLAAKTAWYLPGSITPMAYGFSAQLKKNQKTIDFNTMLKILTTNLGSNRR